MLRREVLVLSGASNVFVLLCRIVPANAVGSYPLPSRLPADIAEYREWFVVFCSFLLDKNVRISASVMLLICARERSFLRHPVPKVGSGAKLAGLRVPFSLLFRRWPGRAIGRGCVSGIACCICWGLVSVI